MKWQDVAKLLTAILVSGVLITQVDLFGAIFQLSGVSYTHSGDIICGEQCNSTINVTTWYWNIGFENTKETQRVYLPYNMIYGGSNETLTSFVYGELSEGNQSVIYKKARWGRKLWINLDKISNIISTDPDQNVYVEWLVPARGKNNWRPIKDGDYWSRLKRPNRIKLIGHKSMYDTIKWNFKTGDYVDIDPVWVGPNKPPGLIEGVDKDWFFKVETLDDVNTTIEQISGSCFSVVPYSVKKDITDALGYEWKFVINYTIDELVITEDKLPNGTVLSTNITIVPINKKDIIKEERLKKDFGKEFSFCVPDEIDRFRIIVGKNSSLIDGSADGIATSWGHNENICIGNGYYHAAWEGGGSDLWYGNSSDNGTTWTAKELLAGTIIQAGVNCFPNGTVAVYFISNSDLLMFQSGDNGTTFSANTVIEDDLTSITQASCDVDSNNIMQCCILDTSDDLSYVNTSDIDQGVEISGDDSDHCDIAVDKDDNPYIIVTDTATDDLDIMSGKDGWSTRNEVGAGLGAGVPSLTLGEGVSIDIDSNGLIAMAAIFSDDLQYCNSTTTDWTQAGSCQELDDTSSFHPDVGISDEGQIYILYSDQNNDGGDVLLANTTDGVNFQTANIILEQASNTGFASMASSRFASTNRLGDGRMHIVYTTTAEVHYRNISIFQDLTKELIVHDLSIDSPSLVQNGTNITINFSVQKGGVNQTLGVTLQNVTINGTPIKFLTTPSAFPSCEESGDLYFDFEEGSGNLVDECNGLIGENFNGVVFTDNTPTFNVSGDGGSFAGSFPDNNDRINVSYTITNVVTISMWVNITNAESRMFTSGVQATGIIKFQNSQGNGRFELRARRQSDNALVCGAIANTDIPGALDDNSFHHIVFQVNGSGGNCQSWHDGDLIISIFGSGTTTSDDFQNFTTFGNSTETNVFSGTIDEIRIFQRWIDNATINEIYNKGLGNPQNQFGYDSTRGAWQINGTVPDKNDSLYDLFVNVTFEGIEVKNITIKSINYSQAGAGPIDSCTPTLNQDWIVSDDCVKTSFTNLGTGSLHTITGGLVTMLNAVLRMKELFLNTTGQQLWLNGTSKLNLTG